MTPKTNKNSIKYYLDFIPLLIILISTFKLIEARVDSSTLFGWQQYVGFVFLACIIVAFFIRHLFGVLASGATLLLGFIGVLSYSPGFRTMGFSIIDGAFELSSLPFQPIFLFWLGIYFIVCWKHILGIGTKQYWNEVKNKQR